MIPNQNRSSFEGRTRAEPTNSRHAAGIPATQGGFMSTLRFQTIALLTAVGFLMGCGQINTPAPDAIDSFTALADAEGDIETTLEVETVLSSQYTATDDLWKFRSPSKGVKGVSFGAPSALKASGKVRLKGRTFKSAGVPVFVGVAQTETTASVSGKAVTQSAPVVLMGEGQNFPGLVCNKNCQEFEAVFVSWWKPSKLGDADVTLFKLASGKPGIGIAFNGPAVAGSSLNASRLKPMVGERTTKLSGTIKIQQTHLGPIGTLEGYTATDDLWKFKSAVVLGWLVGEEDIQNDPTNR
jgi:hypothetical protein